MNQRAILHIPRGGTIGIKELGTVARASSSAMTDALRQAGYKVAAVVGVGLISEPKALP
jgi:hypothetical protein